MTLTLNNLNKLLAEFVVDKIDNSNIDVSCPGKYGLYLHNTGTGKLALIRNKFDRLTAVLSGNIDILFITESKIDSTFPENLLYLNGCSIHDRLTVIFWFMFVMTLDHV